MKKVDSAFISLGLWRSQVLWRFFGFLCLYMAFFQYDSHSLDKILTLFSGVHLLGLTGFLLMVLGPRPITLAISVFGVTSFVLPIIYESVETQLAEEYGILLIIPWVGFLLYFSQRLAAEKLRDLSGKKMALTFHRPFDHASSVLFKFSAVVVMLFATLAKINTDFLNPLVSCGPAAAKFMGELWNINLPDFWTNLPPWAALLSEAIIPVSLLLSPYLGIFITSLVMGVIGHAGAYVFTSSIIVLSFGFLRVGDRKFIWKFLKSEWKWLTAIFSVIGVLSFFFYKGTSPWYLPFTFQIFFGLSCIISISLFFRGISKRKKSRSALNHEFQKRLFFNPLPKHMSFILVLFGLLTILNGLSPYLGLKYRLSFAMLSNLRVDQNRWNSLIFPQFVYLKKHDPFIHVTAVRVHPIESEQQVEEIFKDYYKRAIYQGLFAPMSFKSRLIYHYKARVQVDVQFDYKGKTYYVEDAARNEGLWMLLAQISDSKWIQEYLTYDSPQTCFH